MIRNTLLQVRRHINRLYRREEYLVSLQAYYLLMTCVVSLSATVIVLGFNLLTYANDFGLEWFSPLASHLFLDFLLIVLFVIVLWILLKGDYLFASNLLGVGAVSIILMGSTLNIDSFIHTGLNSFLYLYYVSALLISFFNQKSVRIFLGIVIVLSNGLLYFIVIISNKTIVIKEILHSFFNSTSTLTVVLFISYFIAQMMFQIIEDKEKASTNNSELNAMLEHKVVLRTQELMTNNQQLKSEMHKLNVVENALKESEIRYRTIFENSGTAIFTIDSMGLISLCNSKFCHISGYDKNEIENKISWTKFIHHDDFKRAYHFISAIQSQAEYETQADFRFINRFGRLYELSIYVEKISDQQELIVSLLDITEQKNALKKLQILASVDSLTELYNRRYFTEHMAVYLNHAKNEHLVAGVLYLDIDNFKNINDTYGHAIGDDLLHDVAERLKKLVAPNGLAARIGGDEFAMLMFAKETDTVKSRVTQFIKDMEVPFAYDVVQITISFSIGISIYPDQGNVGEQLLDQADQAMYQAKKQGKNRYALLSNEEAL